MNDVLAPASGMDTPELVARDMLYGAAVAEESEKSDGAGALALAARHAELAQLHRCINRDYDEVRARQWAVFDLLVKTRAATPAEIEAKAGVVQTALQEDCGEEAQRLLASIRRDLTALAAA